MDDNEIVRRLDQVRERVRTALADQGPPERIAEALPPDHPLELGEPARSFDFPAEPNLNDTAHLRAANRDATITGPVSLTSKVPIIGPVLTLARRLARPFVQPLIDPYLDRQERFNVQVVRHLNELGQRLEQRLERIAEELQHWLADPSLLEARLDAALTDYDEVLRARHTVLFDALEEEIIALRQAVRDAQQGLGERMHFLEARFVERAQAIDARFDEKDRVLEHLQARTSGVADAELMQTRRMLKQVLEAASRGPGSSRPDAGGEPGGEDRRATDWDRLYRWLLADDYRAFQNRFRGDEQEIARRMQGHVEHFRNAPGPVVDLGCGRGEFLELLGKEGIEAVGVEINQAEVEEGERRGLAIEHADLFSWLQQRQEESLGGIFLAQVIEHLQPSDWGRFVELAASRLVARGTLLVETINPESLYAGARAFAIDPTHTRPVHPQLLAFLARRAGFEDVAIHYQAEVPAAERVTEVDEEPFIDSPSALALVREINLRIRRIDKLCCAPQEYALVAVRAGATTS